MQSPIDSPRGRLLAQYVRARIVDLRGINIGLFDYDRNNAIYFFILNGDEQIYLRYGGRDARSAMSYLDLDSLAVALDLGLKQHELWKQGKLPPREAPPPKYPQDIPLLRQEIMSGGRCVECHLVGDYELQELERAGTLDRAERMYRSPDIRTLGIELDVPKGLVVKETSGPVAQAGMRAGDRIAAVNGTPVLTFGDLQYYYDKTPRDAQRAVFTVERGGERYELLVDLPREWWVTDLSYRFLSVDPQLYFKTRALSAEAKAGYGLKAEGFASEVVEIDPAAKVYIVHELQLGDIIYSVNGVEEDALTRNVELYMKLNVRAGDAYSLKLIRNGERMDMQGKTRRWSFRKPES